MTCSNMRWKVARSTLLVVCMLVFCAQAFTIAVAQDRDTEYPDKGGGPAPVAVWVDIMPKSCPNQLDNTNLYVRDYNRYVTEDDYAEAAAKGSTGWKRTVLDVAILGNYRANMAQVDPSSIRIECFRPVQTIHTDAFTQPHALVAELNERSCCEPGGDGFNDLLLRVEKVCLWRVCGNAQDGAMIPITVTALLLDGTRIRGTDWVEVCIPGEEPATGDRRPPTALGPCFPNPFNPATSFTASFAESGPYEIAIYNIQGRLIRTFAGEAAAGTRTFTWDGTDYKGRAVASGLYLCRLSTPELTATSKMMLLR